MVVLAAAVADAVVGAGRPRADDDADVHEDVMMSVKMTMAISKTRMTIPHIMTTTISMSAMATITLGMAARIDDNRDHVHDGND